MTRTVLIEGWRGISHSYALVNQNQILALLPRAGIELRHRDLPFYMARWNAADANAGFDPADQALIDGVPPLGDRRADTIFRIAYPLRAYGGDAERVFAFCTREYVGPPKLFRGPETAAPYSNRAFKLITPSQWSRAALVAAGYRPDDVIVVPHGVNPDIFRPLASEERARARRTLRLPPASFVFLNVGGMMHNKGVDKLLAAFAAVHGRFPEARLILKDSAPLYDIHAKTRVAEFRRGQPALASERVMNAISFISQNLRQRELAVLYAACDAYISPYRAEGFNLPPLEAAACGTPMAVTAGGASDDYFDPRLGLQIASKPWMHPQLGLGRDPDLDSLVDCMTRMIDGRFAPPPRETSAAIVHERHSWGRVADRLVELF